MLVGRLALVGTFGGWLVACTSGTVGSRPEPAGDACTGTACAAGDADRTADADLCAGVTCGGQGSCVVTVGVASCACAGGYHAVGLTCVANVVTGTVVATLAPEGPTSGLVVVNFALPLARAVLTDVRDVTVWAGAVEAPAARRGLSRWRDGSWRSVQLQVEVDADLVIELHLEVGRTATTADRALLPVADTLMTVTEGGQSLAVPRVWVVLPAEHLAASGVFGALLPQSTALSQPLDAWRSLCDYDTWGVSAFLASTFLTAREVWLYDRGTALYRAYAQRGDLPTLMSAAKETWLYFARITPGGGSAAIDLPQSGGSDAKYVYTQNLAYHFLLTGDDRFREAAEGMATLAASLFNPTYVNGRFWTERNAGFTLLANVFAAMISDDRRAELLAEAVGRLAAYRAVQTGYSESPANDAAGARCFAHDKVAADEDGTYPATMICSPWMSAILADGLDALAQEAEPGDAAVASAALVALGKRLALTDNQDGDGRPYYILGVDDAGVPDDYDEHWGETAYVIALAYVHGGATDTALRAAALAVADGMASFGGVGQLRSFNWQCRSAVATPALLTP